MKTYAGNLHEKQHETAGKGGKASASQFADHRPGAAVQRKLQDLVNSSARVARLGHMQALAAGPVAQLRTININPLFQGTLGPQIDTDELDETEMNELEGQIEELAENPVGSTVEERKHYQGLLTQLRSEISDAFRAGDYKDGSPMLDYHRPSDPWSTAGDEEWLESPELEKKQALVAMVKQVVDLADTMPDQLKSIMQHDAIYNMSPEGQLEFCVNESKGYDAGTLAKCLYTSYFYEPINKFLRGQLPMGVDKKIRDLVLHTLGILQQTIKDDAVVHEIATFRMELKAEWMGNPVKDSVLNFPAFTSTHPSAGGIDKMLEDIGKGTFGEVTRLAVLKFQGRTKVLQPDVKYFPDEVETIIPPGMKAKVAAVKDIELDIPKMGKKPAKEYTLQIIDT